MQCVLHVFLNPMICLMCADLRHFASSSGGLVVSVDPDTGTVSSLSLLVFMMNLLNGFNWIGVPLLL